MAWDVYYGPTDLESLSMFAKGHIGKPICSAYNTDSCDEREAATIKKLMDMDPEEFDKLFEQAQTELQAFVDKFEKAGQEMMDRREVEVDKVNEMIEKITTKFNWVYVDQVMRKRELGHHSADYDIMMDMEDMEDVEGHDQF